MVGIIVEIEAAIAACGVIVVAADALTVLTSLIRSTGMATFSTICLVGLEVDASLSADIQDTHALAAEAQRVASTSLITLSTMRFIELWIDARLIADQQRRRAILRACSLEAEVVARLVAASAVLWIRPDVDTSAAAGGLAGLADQLAITHHTALIAEARILTVTAVFRRTLRVYAYALALFIGLGAITVTSSIHAELAIRTLHPTRTTVVEVAPDVHAAVTTPLLRAWALDDTCAILTNFIIETRLIAATAVIHVAIGIDTDSVTVYLVRLGTAFSMIRQSIAKIGVREIRIFFATPGCHHQREQGGPYLPGGRQCEAPITCRVDEPVDRSTRVLAALHEWFFR